MKTLWRQKGFRTLLFIHTAILGALLLFLLGRALLPKVFAILFFCPMRPLHLYCPGCGGTRALERLLRFDLAGSFLANPNPLVWIATLLYVDLRSFLLFKKNGEMTAPYFNRRLFILLMAVYLLTFLLRNLLLVIFRIDFLGDHATFWRKIFAVSA